MILDKYDQAGWLFNTNFRESAPQDGVFGYRGELVLIEGKIADAKGRTKPPVALMRHTILLEKDGKLAFVVGVLDQLELITAFIEKYKPDFADDIKVLFYVVNITTPMQVQIEGVNFVLIPLSQGVAWNELIDELGLEKSDFKGQSPAEKIMTAWEEFKSYTPKYDVYSLEQALTMTAEIKWEAHGAV